jgi:hypothetical protein
VVRDDLIYRIQIHETADIDAAHRFWLDVTGAKGEQFRRPTIKRHNPKTLRTNVGDSYHGCLRVDVRRSSTLYRQIEGWARAAMTVSNTTVTPWAPEGSPSPDKRSAASVCTSCGAQTGTIDGRSSGGPPNAP